MEYFQSLTNFFYKNFYFFLILLAALSSALGNIFIKKSQNYSNFFNSLISLDFFLGIMFYVFNLLLFAFSLKYIEVSKAYPILAGLGFLFLIILSNLLIGEELSLRNYIGVACVIIGIIFIAR
jgi:multidrug transporter EmrE-like cation transporter